MAPTQVRPAERREAASTERFKPLALMAMCGTCMVLVAACVSSPGVVSPPFDVPAAFSASGTTALPDSWWTVLGDERLDAMVEEALSGNFTLRAAWDRLDQMWALAARSAADLRPTVDGSVGVSRSTSETSDTDRSSETAYSLGLSASYEVDLWGRLRASRDAARFGALATAEDLAATAMTLSAEIANTWYQLVEAHGQLRLIDEQLKTNTDYLDIITVRFRRGQASATDVLQQRQLIEATRGNRIQAEATVGVLEHALAVLLGRTPGDAAFPTSSALPAVPALPETGLPAVWLQRRPDLRAAALRVQSADRELAAAIAERLPKLALSLSADSSAEALQDLFDNWLASLAANLTAPLFDGGSRRAEVERTRAAASEALNDYGQTLLSALQDVEDALALERAQADYLATLETELELSASATEQTRERYIRTGADFTRYLTTLISHQSLQRTYLASQRQRLGYRIDLYRALGGSWPLSRPAPLTPADSPDE